MGGWWGGNVDYLNLFSPQQSLRGTFGDRTGRTCLAGRALFGGCGRVWNVVARLEGTRPGKAVVLMAHYDSVHTSPGAVDNAVSVGLLLELARVLVMDAPSRRVIIAFTAAEVFT